eukprot:Gb_12606 [translate_table: standard]
MHCATTGPATDDAVKVINRAIRRARVGLKKPRRPIASFIFSRPTGVGKSELAKALATYYFGLEEAMIRLDMSEFMERHIEKAHPHVLNAMLQILEDGRLTDSNGSAVDFKNTVLIMTCNVGSSLIEKGGAGLVSSLSRRIIAAVIRELNVLQMKR